LTPGLAILRWITIQQIFDCRMRELTSGILCHSPHEYVQWKLARFYVNDARLQTAKTTVPTFGFTMEATIY